MEIDAQKPRSVENELFVKNLWKKPQKILPDD